MCAEIDGMLTGHREIQDEIAIHTRCNMKSGQGRRSTIQVLIDTESIRLRINRLCSELQCSQGYSGNGKGLRQERVEELARVVRGGSEGCAVGEKNTLVSW